MYDDTPIRLFDFHDSMLGDERRTRGFLDAIVRTVRAGDVVLDLGCGTGVLSLFACLAGAARVYAVEHESVINVARDIVSRSQFDQRIDFIAGWSTRIDLPEPVDVIISETIGNMAFEEGIVGSVTDARKRFLAPGGRLIPRSLELVTALVESPGDHADLDRWANPFYGFDFSPLRAMAVNTPLPTTLSERSLMSGARPIVRVDLTSVEEGSVSGRVELSARRSGWVHGLGCWFSSELSPGNVLTNGPPNRVPSWDQVLLPFDEPFFLERGDIVRTEISSADNGGYWQWQVDARAKTGPIVIRQSSVRFDPRHIA